jgi:beta-glucanase (GH16 family)
MIRSKFVVTPGMYVEMRAKLTRGVGAWPAFWLNPGEERPDGSFSETPWPPEIDIFEFFNWQGRPKTLALATNIQVNNQPEKYGNPYTIFSATNKDGDFVPGMDFSEGFHVFALDWQEDRPIWLLDGHPIKQVYYQWHAPPAHILVTNQLGIKFGDMKEMVIDENNWNYVIDYIRVWKRKTP